MFEIIYKRTFNFVLKITTVIIKNFKYFYIDIGITIFVSLQALTIWEILYRILPYRFKCTQ
jgi:hypothetical protein